MTSLLQLLSLIAILLTLSHGQLYSSSADGAPTQQNENVLTRAKRKLFSDDYLNALEKQWESGDDESELVDDVQEKVKRQQKEAETSTHLQEEIDPNNPLQYVQKMSERQTLSPGPVMVFANLAPKAGGQTWERRETDSVAEDWFELLRMGSIDAKVYVVDEDSILVYGQARDGNQIKNFLLQRQEVQEVTWNQKTYYPDWVDEVEKQRIVQRKQQKVSAEHSKTVHGKETRRRKTKRKTKFSERDL